jgi:hypothetical protein
MFFEIPLIVDHEAYKGVIFTDAVLMTMEAETDDVRALKYRLTLGEDADTVLGTPPLPRHSSILLQAPLPALSCFRLQLYLLPATAVVWRRFYQL